MSSSSGDSGTLDPIAVDPDDPIPTDPEIHTSDTDSSDDDDFQPFSLPDFGDDVQLADGILDGNLPLMQIPAPVPLAAFPMADLPLNVVSDDDINLFDEGPPEDNHEGGAPIADDVAIPLVEAPVEEILSDQSGADSFESVSSCTLHAVGLHRHPIDSDSDMAMSAAPDHEFDLADDVEHEMDHAPDEQPFVAPVAAVAPVALVAPIDQPPVAPADLDPAPADPVPLPDHDPIFAEIPDIAPILPNPVLMFDHAPFATLIDPRYADTHNGWVDDDDYPPYVRPVTPSPHPSLHRLMLPLIFSMCQMSIVPTFLSLSSRTFLHLVLKRVPRGSSLLLSRLCL
ncbi:hypothetical protein HanPI659440_Chr11g0428261 [Helianthus annuus]|nr:hypothetical protein HanPI659440_Chr11g0428261 [Helianthus annuus]